MQDQDNNNILISLAGMSLMASDEKFESHPELEVLSAFTDDSMSKQEQVVVKKHIVSCSQCYQQWFELKKQIMIEADNLKPWYQNIFELNFKLNPMPINFASGAVAASLIFLLVSRMMPDESIITDHDIEQTIERSVASNISFSLPSKLEELSTYCKDCSKEDYASFSKDLISQLNQDCGKANLSESIQQQVNTFLTLYPEENQQDLMNAIKVCQASNDWSD